MKDFDCDIYREAMDVGKAEEGRYYYCADEAQESIYCIAIINGNLSSEF